MYKDTELKNNNSINSPGLKQSLLLKILIACVILHIKINFKALIIKRIKILKIMIIVCGASIF